MENRTEEGPETSLFPLFPTAASDTGGVGAVPGTSTTSQWLCNTSFTVDLSVVNDAVSSVPHPTQSDQENEGAEGAAQFGDDSNEKRNEAEPSKCYELLEDSIEGADKSFGSDRDSDSEKRVQRKKKRNKKRKRKPSLERGTGLADFGSRKSHVGTWSETHTKPAKDYYFDTHPDPDNLAYGSLYRMDIPRYKLCDPEKLSGFASHGFYRWNQKGSVFDRDGDADALDNKVKSGGRYWSAKYAALERHKNLKRVHLAARRKYRIIPSEDFISLLDIETSRESVDSGSISNNSMFEESWEDEVLRKTREFNKLTRENPHDENAWLAFAQFQDKVASMQPQKGARLQTLEKKISILEKASELNPDNDELLLCLLKAYQKRDSTDVLVSRWEKVLMQHSGNYKLWREFLHVVQGEFSRFKVSEVRKMYSHAIRALSAACSKQLRQAHQTAKPPEPAIVQLEHGLVDIFISLCRFEWQSGYQELATALFQAEIEFTLFSPSLLLTEQSKQRLFEHFWNSNGARIGEEGALGWSTWLEKEEENRQRAVKEETSDDNQEGGWSGWSEPLSKNNEASITPEHRVKNDVAADGFEEEIENEDTKEEDDTEALLKLLGIGAGAGAGDEVKDTSTWVRWSEEELMRDCNQWMPVRTKCAGVSCGDETTDREMDEQFLRVVLYVDVSEYLFSLSSEAARLSLVYQFIDFFGGKISQWTCTNSSSWIEKVRSLEVLPDSIMEKLRRAHDFMTRKQGNANGFSLEALLASSNDISRRAEIMKFLRNAALLCLTAFPRNYILEEVALVAEELFIMKTNSCRFSAAPCQALAKRLLKSDRQDLLLCGVYARREAAFSNIDHARRVFDMALSSISALPLDLQSHAPLLYLWYAEAELGKNSSGSQESFSRAQHILSCLGSGVAYSPYKCKPSSLQLLRAHQGFRERIKAVQSTWVHGIIDDQSVALICSAALFEELTTGWAAGIEVLHQAYNMVLPDRKSQSYQLEFLFNYNVRMLQRHYEQLSLPKLWESISQGLQIYPYSPELLTALVEVSHLYTTPNKLRWMLDDYCQKKPSVIVWLFALLFEISRGGSQHRVHSLFERAMANDTLRNSVVLWRCYLAYEIEIACNPSAARRIFFRAIHACPWSKKLWLDGFLRLNSILTAKELSDLQEVMRDKELNLRTDIYEILLQDEFVS